MLWSDLAALGPAGADAVIAAEVRQFAGLGCPWEWKYYSYDQPADLPGRLAAAGLAAEPAETLLVAEIAQLDLDVWSPAGVELFPVAGRGAGRGAVRDEVSVVTTRRSARPSRRPCSQPRRVWPWSPRPETSRSRPGGRLPTAAT